MSERTGGWSGLRRDQHRFVRAGAVLGLGIGGFFDGIVFHQVLQWHHLLSAHPDPSVAGDLELNVFADGLFHVATYVFTVAGVGLLWRAWRDTSVVPSERRLVGATVLGWGIFNVVEGLVDHQILGIHHVWADGPGGVLLWDVGFLVWGLLFVVGGYALVRGGESDSSVPGGRREPTEREE